MAVQREKIMAALFARLSAIQGDDGAAYFKYTSRIYESWDDTPPAVQPAMFMVKGPEQMAVKVVGMPTGASITARVVVYVQKSQTTHEDPSVPPSILLNDVITRIELSLQHQPPEARSPFAQFPGNPPGYFVTTLGGLCYSCQIVGTVEVFDGTIAGTAVAIMTIECLTTG